MPSCKGKISLKQIDTSNMKYLLEILFCSMLISTCSIAQSNDEFDKSQPPSFIGGEVELFKFLGKNLVYPKQANLNCISGKVQLSFLIDSIGNVSDTEIVKSLGFGCDEEATKVILLTSGRWNPATKNGKPELVRIALPVMFLAQKDCVPYYEELLEKGNRFFEKEKFEKAILYYDETIMVKPFHPEALLKRGLSKLYLGNKIAACEDWNEIPKILQEEAEYYISKHCHQ